MKAHITLCFLALCAPTSADEFVFINPGPVDNPEKYSIWPLGTNHTLTFRWADKTLQQFSLRLFMNCDKDGGAGRYSVADNILPGSPFNTTAVNRVEEVQWSVDVHFKNCEHPVYWFSLFEPGNHQVHWNSGYFNISSDNIIDDPGSISIPSPPDTNGNATGETENHTNDPGPIATPSPPDPNGIASGPQAGQNGSTNITAWIGAGTGVGLLVLSCLTMWYFRSRKKSLPRWLTFRHSASHPDRGASEMGRPVQVSSHSSSPANSGRRSLPSFADRGPGRLANFDTPPTGLIDLRRLLQ